MPVYAKKAPKTTSYRRRTITRKPYRKMPMYRNRTVNSVTGVPLVLTDQRAISYYQLSQLPYGFTTHAGCILRSTDWSDMLNPWLSVQDGGTGPLADVVKRIQLKTINHQISLMRYQDVFLSKIQFEFIPCPTATFSIQLNRTSHIFTVTQNTTGSNKWIVSDLIDDFMSVKNDSSKFIISPSSNGNRQIKYKVTNKFSDDLLFKQTTIGGFPDFRTRTTEWLMNKDILYLKCVVPESSVDWLHIRPLLMSQFLTVRAKYYYSVRGSVGSY